MRTLSDGDRWHGPDWDALARLAFEDGTVILSGCSPSKGTGDSVDVASGTAAINPNSEDDAISVASGNVSLAARDGYARFDLVTVQSNGSLNGVTGTSELTAPDIPAGEALVAVVRVPDSASANSITVKDARIVTSKAFVDLLLARDVYADSATVTTLTVNDMLNLPTVTSDPSSPGTATMWYRSDLD